MCGEYSNTIYEANKAVGSPPRVRGIRSTRSRVIRNFGITPACAGNTPSVSVTVNNPWDHPRVCGEYFFAILAPSFHAGSPPRVRGILTDAYEVKSIYRITPACAGNTIMMVSYGAME